MIPNYMHSESNWQIKLAVHDSMYACNFQDTVFIGLQNCPDQKTLACEELWIICYYPHLFTGHRNVDGPCLIIFPKKRKNVKSGITIKCGGKLLLTSECDQQNHNIKVTVMW